MIDYNSIRLDHKKILEMISARSTVLDLGCGNGELLSLLIKEKNVRAQGIEIDEQAIYKCVARGLNVFHGDIDSGLAEYKDKSFDYVILNQSLQQVKHLERVLMDALRVGKKTVVGFPNFNHFKARWQFFFRGRAPVTESLPYAWYESPNLHFFSIYDFIDFCSAKGIRMENKVFLSSSGQVSVLPNLFASGGVFLLSQ